MKEIKLAMAGVLVLLLFIGYTVYHKAIINQPCPMAIAHDINGKNNPHNWVDTGVVVEGEHQYQCTWCDKLWYGNMKGNK